MYSLPAVGGLSRVLHSHRWMTHVLLYFASCMFVMMRLIYSNGWLKDYNTSLVSVPLRPILLYF